jgi:hypothetical protein
VRQRFRALYGFAVKRPPRSWLGSLARRRRYAPFVLSAQRLVHDVTSPAEADFLQTHNEGMSVMAPNVQANNEGMSVMAPNVQAHNEGMGVMAFQTCRRTTRA